jgi:adenine phosphoribosyltransferase
VTPEIDLDHAIRKIPDFPKPGVLFYDITGILVNPEAFNYCLERMQEIYRDTAVTAVAAIEARGFVFASPFAARCRLPLILIRKKNKLPGETYSRRFALEYGEDEIEVHKSDIRAGQSVLLVDDLIATGGTLRAACSLLEEAGANVAGIFSVVGLPFLDYGKVLAGYPVQTLIQYQGE